VRPVAATRFGLYELLAPQFLLGFTFPEHIDRYLSVLGVDDLRSLHDATGVVHSGRCSFTGAAGASPVRAHHDPSGAVFEWEDVTLDFRLSIPRDGAQFISTAVGNATLGSPELNALFNRFGPIELTTAPTEYPGVRFRLELLLSVLTFHLGKDWRPAVLDGDHRVVPDPSPSAPKDIRFVLPKVVLVYEQGDDLTRPPTFELASWGSGGFDAPHDLAAGELVRMEPALAVHSSGRVGFGVDQVILDLSPDATPPEILQFFGIDEAFRGVYVRSARVYYGDRQKDLAINIGVQDVLVSFAGEVSLEASLDVIGPKAPLSAEIRLFEGDRPVSYVKGRTSGLITPGQATILNTGELQALVSGGIPPYVVSMRLGDGGSAPELWDAVHRRAPISPPPPATRRAPGTATLHITVADAGKTGANGTRQTYLEDIELTIRAAPSATDPRDGLPSDHPLETAARADAVFTISSRNPDPLPTDYAVTCTPAASGLVERIVVAGGPASVTVDGASRSLDAAGGFSLEVSAGADVQIAVSWPGTSAASDTVPQVLRFTLDQPDPTASAAGREQLVAAYAKGSPDPPDSLFDDGALRSWLAGPAARATHFKVHGHASFEHDTNAPRDLRLSQDRLEIARRIIVSERPGAVFDEQVAHGHDVAKASDDPHSGKFRAAQVSAVLPVLPSASVQARITRASTSTTTPAPAPAPGPPPEPDPKPSVFRRAGLRVRLERNVLVLAEISGRLDFETDLEARLRQQPGVTPATLHLQQTAGASTNPNPEDGVVDFLLNVTYDPATRQLAERLAIGASPEDRDGLLHMTNPAQSPRSAENVFKDIFGALLVMAPVINAAAAAVDPANAGDWAAVGVSLAVPVAVGGLGIFNTEKAILYGGELTLRQSIPPGETVALTDAGVMFDYAVEFGIRIDALDIKTAGPIKVRYRAVGFNLHFAGGVSYQPIFDTSKGYELNLTDAGSLNLPSPLGDLLKILSARIARVNPLTLEAEIGLKVDLGVVSVESFKLRWPLDDPTKGPSILPTGIKVDIGKVLLGSGYVKIIEPDPNAEGVGGGGFEGQADVSLVSLKLRISAALGVRMLGPINGRKAVALFAGLIIELPAPIPLGNTGLGIYGFSGLFAMHYKRDEQPPDGTAVSPALRWLIRARGEPAKLVVGGDTLWVPELDRWSFGIGIILGTTEGGFVANLRGMLVLELPGPRILIFIKLQIVAALPDMDEGGLTAGLLGVIDLDFQRMQLTLGIVADLGIGEVLRVTVPTELFVKLDNPRIWHLYLGKHNAPATAVVLNLVRASGYFMVEGDRIENWPGTEPPSTLTGLALAAGLEAAIVLGDESIGLYLRVAVGAHFGVSFSPKLFIAGRIYLEGELRLFIVSIEAHGTLQAQVLVESPTQARTFLDGEICGKVSFFFFSVEGCVRHSIGIPVNAPPPADLCRNVFLQSHAPVLTAGQGGDRPIDASLGDASHEHPDGSVTGTQPTVPVDSVPVIQFGASPTVTGATTFTQPLVTSPQQTADGFIPVGGGREARYELKEISLSPTLAAGAGLPPATWRTERPPDPKSADTTIDLALMSRAPTVASRALERSTELDAQIQRRWGDLCNPVAPPVCVLYTFCGQRLGPSGNGWHLTGTPQPDPPGTTRSQPPPTRLDIDEPPRDQADAILDILLDDAGHSGTFPAEVIGPNINGGGPEEPPVGDLDCVRFPRPLATPQPNPLVRSGVHFEVHDSSGALTPNTRIASSDSVVGLDVGFLTEIALDAPSPLVRVEIATFAQPARVSAFGATGQLLDVATTSVAHAAETLVLRGMASTPIVRLRVDAKQDETLLASICFVARPRIEIPRLPLPFPRPTGDERLDRLAAGHHARRALRDQLAGAAEAERIEAFAPAPRPGLAAIARRGHAAAAADPKLCFRALKLPLRGPSRKTDVLQLTPELKKHLASRPDDRWIVLNTGRATEVQLLLAVPPALLTAGLLLLEQLDATGALLGATAVPDLSPTTVTGVISGLPAEWLDPTGPWETHVRPAAQFLAEPEFAALTRLLVTIKPQEDCDRLRLRVAPTAPVVDPPGVLIGVAEVCPAIEQTRAGTDEEVKQGQIETLIDYLNRGAVVPLLAPSQTYTLTVRYDVSARLEGGQPAPQGSRTERFRFKADSQPPARLDPWVLGTAPDDGERHHFTADPVKLVFNDLAILQLYAAYGRKLRFVLRSADGVPIPTHEIAALDPVEAGLTSPYREFLEAMIAAGELPCAGSAAADMHGSWTSPVPLRPLMDYTLEVETDPAPAVTADASTPLFRRAFTTSRFDSVAALVDDLKVRRVRHRAITAPITGLPSASGVEQASDETVQAALIAAGERALPSPRESGIVVYWLKRGGANTFSPHAILIDAAEPLWRSRQEPALETVPGQLDPAYKRIVPATVPAMQLAESGSSAIARFVRSPGGTRTLALIKDTFVPTGTSPITIRAERTSSALYGIAAATTTVLDLVIGGAAPWETDDGP
jgi:hypothetical protein